MIAVPEGKEHQGCIMKKTDIIDQVASNNNITKSEAKRWVESVYFALRDSLIVNREVSLTGIGKIRARNRPARVVRNPKTGTKVEKGPTVAVKFSTSSTLRKDLQA